MNRLFGRTAALAWLLWVMALMTPSVSAHQHYHRASHGDDGPSHARRALAGGMDLRILPLGDSITWGYASSDGNGYRQHLRNKLSGGGNAVSFVGSQISGSMPNGNNEGHNGALINEIATFFNSAGGLRSRPNVVLLLAGTNDMNRPFDPSTAPDRLDALVGLIVNSASGADQPLVVVGKIPPNGNPSANSRTATFNSALEGIVRKYQDQGGRVLLANMFDALRLDADLGDGLHPNAGGYAKMADVWYSALADAAGRGWISKPAPAPDSNSAACKKALFWDAVYGEVASGVGSGDPTQFPGGKWWDRGTVHEGHGTDLKGKGFVHMADLNGDGLDDYVWVDAKSGAAALYLNTGDFSAKWNSIGTVASGVGAGVGVRFADIDGDGKADFLWLDSVDGTANVRYYRNGGLGSDNKWIWYDEGVIFSGKNILFGDLDGDGRADIALRGENGALVGYLNVGPGVKPNFRHMGEIASGVGVKDPRVELKDLNGDGRADYLYIAEDGSLTVYINMLDQKVNAVPTWVGLGTIASGVAKGDNVIFGDLSGDGKVDYIVINKDTGAINLWQNQGSGSTFRAGHNIFLADLNGDGKDDYLIVSPGGAIELYLNGGASGIKWIWFPQGQIASGVGQRANIRYSNPRPTGLGHRTLGETRM
ncbi:hypothetical protein GE09DRAFT_187533 [Coniochaeta sp. 2T2.1]|nr:hypothetical protein GE09DRAFT_187533 [Coniochaeta sp. 2T2.1]